MPQPISANPDLCALQDEFLTTWPPERLRTMTLDEYAAGGGNKDSFCYWLEKRLEDLGSIWGGSAFKFGVYIRNDTEAKPRGRGRAYSERYGWATCFGDSPEEAFEKFRSLILQVVDAIRDNRPDEVDAIDMGPVLKWKIAFHYQNFDNPSVLNVFRISSLARFLGRPIPSSTVGRMAPLYAEVLARKPDDVALCEFGREVFLTVPNTLPEFIADHRARYGTAEQVSRRAEFEAKARHILSANLGRMTGEQIREFLDWAKTSVNQMGKPVKNRFGIGFTGSTANSIVRTKDAFNRWTQRLWEADIDNPSGLADLLTEFWHKNEVDGAGYLLPTVILYLRAPERFFIWMKQTHQGVNKATESDFPMRRDGGLYLNVNEAVQRFREQFELPPQYVDQILSGISSEYNPPSISVAPTEEDDPEDGDNAGDDDDDDSGAARPVPAPVKREAYTLDELALDVFVPRAELRKILDVWARKKNIVLEGPPGVGKTFLAKYLAFALMGERDDDRDRIEMVQFHPSYAYEDFIQGYRPEDTGFRLRDGIFHAFCAKAKADPGRKHVFIIDEINRGNLAKIFGELMLLLEADKRGGEHSVQLQYARDPASPKSRFSIPENVYLLGTMNTADRSLALVDYALRRRFAFFELQPMIGSVDFNTHLREAGVPETLIEHLNHRLGDLNARIESAEGLGRAFRIGHSYFCLGESDRFDDDEAARRWYNQIVELEILPLLREYWHDRPGEVESVALAWTTR